MSSSCDAYPNALTAVAWLPVSTGNQATAVSARGKASHEVLLRVVSLVTGPPLAGVVAKHDLSNVSDFCITLPLI